VRRSCGFHRGGLAVALALALGCGTSCRVREPAPAPEATASPVRFYHERVTVEPSERRTRVVGIYDFRNESDAPADVTIRYPFPVDRHHLYPFLVRVHEEVAGAMEPLGFIRVDPDIAWRLSFAPREQKRVRVEYVQEIRERRAVYIVTTTRGWGRPIELAEFEFRVPASLRGVTLSIEPDTVESRGDTVVYRIALTDFMPDSELVLSWD